MTQKTVEAAQRREPPQVWPANAQIEKRTGWWWVAHVKPRQEKTLARDILASRGAYFLPMYEAARRNGRRRWKSTLPLFPGYVFLCCAGENHRLTALKTNRIVRLIEVPDQKQLVDELSAIRRLLESHLAIDPYKSLRKGTRCRICSGLLQGVEGRVERRSGRSRFIVEVSILGQGASVEIDADLLEPSE